jgi:hypothetical protein
LLQAQNNRVKGVTGWLKRLKFFAGCNQIATNLGKGSSVLPTSGAPQAHRLPVYCGPLHARFGGKVWVPAHRIGRRFNCILALAYSGFVCRCNLASVHRANGAGA